MTTRTLLLSLVCLITAPLLPAQEPAGIVQAPHCPVIAVTGRDDVAINAAVKSLPESGGVVFLPAGIYTLRNPVIIDRDKVLLKGVGPETLLRKAADSNSPAIILGPVPTPPPFKVRNVAVTDLEIDGNRCEQSQECWDGACDSGGTSYIRNNCITIRSVEDCRVERVRAHRARSGGVVVEKISRRVLIRDLEAFDNYYDGLACYETEDSVFTGLYLHHNPGAGVSLDIDFHRNVIANSVLEKNGGQGIFMRDSSGNAFQNLIIRDNGNQGVFIAQTDYDTSTPCRDNVFSACTFTGMKGPAIRINDVSCIGNVVMNSRFSGNEGGDASEAVPGLLLRPGAEPAPDRQAQADPGRSAEPASAPVSIPVPQSP